MLGRTRRAPASRDARARTGVRCWAGGAATAGSRFCGVSTVAGRLGVAADTTASAIGSSSASVAGGGATIPIAGSVSSAAIARS